MNDRGGWLRIWFFPVSVFGYPAARSRVVIVAQDFLFLTAYPLGTFCD